VVGYPILHRLVLDISKKLDILNNIDIVTELYDPFLDKIDDPEFISKELPRLTANSVLVAADRCAAFLRENHHIPVIPVKFSGYALMEALKMARKYLEDANDEVVLVNYYKEMEKVEEYRDFLKIRVRQVVFNSHEEADAIFSELKKEGKKVVIGGSNAIDTAEKYGMKGIFMYTRTAVEKTMVHAAEILQAIRNETEKAERFKTIIELVHSGIICTDNNWQITIFNNAAEKILNISADKAINNSIKHVLPSINLPQKPHQLTALTNKLVCTEQVNVIMDIMPIMVNDNCTEAVFAIQDAATIQKSEQEIRQQMHHKRLLANYTFANIVGESQAVQIAVSKAKSFGQTDSTILINGETGTGKELFAQSIHNISPRHKKPFMAINCAAIPESLLDSELFGYEQGAFTGAQKEGKPGLFELTHTGTIFLDEVGELTSPVQSRLLRVLQEKEVMRVGGRKIIPVDVRIIAATNRNLWNEVKAGNFREDLYYRLSVLELNIPPLRERKEDIPLLAKSILRKNMPMVDSILIENIQLLAKDYHWPGNIRELENILERFAVLSKGKPNIEEILGNVFWDSIKDKKIDIPGDDESLSTLSVLSALELNSKMKKIESHEINRLLEEVNGNKTAAARMLGISRSTLWRKLKGISSVDQIKVI
jgi:propionate catabolism operon transcriptional regulator